MNKKFLICGAIATALLVSACVKKEEHKDHEEDKVENTQPASEPSQFQSLPSVEQNSAQNTQQAEIPPHVQIERPESPNLSTEVRTTTHEARATTNEATATESHSSEESKPKAEAKPAKAESVKTETAQTKAPAKSGSAQSEDDAVAAAIAAATPALKN